MYDEIDQKIKYVKSTRFFLRFFSPAHFDHWKLIQPTSVPDDLVTMGPVSDEIDQKTKYVKCLEHYLFLRFFL